jgi:AraC-like DNA-binding protein
MSRTVHDHRDHEDSVRGLPRWKDLIRERFVALDIRPDDQLPIRGRVTEHFVGPLAVASVRSVGQTFRRTSRLIDRHGEDRFQVGLLRSGDARLEQDGRAARIRPGSFVVYDTTRPFTWTMSGPWRMDVFTWALDDVPLDTRHVATLTARPVDDGVSALIARAALTQLATIPRSVDGTEGVQLASRIADLVLTAVAHHGPPVPDVPATLQLRHVLEVIETRLDDPGLSPAAIAMQCHLSLRTLHRLFAAQPRSLARWIRFRRLERARAELGTHPDLPVAVVAARHCFSDPTVFARAFRDEYGLSPREFRQTAGGRAAVSRTAHDVGFLARSARSPT